MNPTIRAAILATLVAAVPAMSHAADPTPDQAQQLQRQLRDWFASVAGPDIPVAASPIQVAAEGDHFRLTVPITTTKAGMPFVYVGNARPATGNRWNLDDLHLTTPATITVDTPVAPAEGEKAGQTIQTTYTLTYAEQTGTGTWDPTYATPSVIASASRGMQLEASNDLLKQTTRVARTESTTTLTPVAGARTDMVLTATAEGYSLVTTAPGQPADGASIKADAREIKVGATLSGVSRDHAAQLIPALYRLGQATSSTATPKPRVKSEAAQPLIAAFTDLANGMTVTETASDFKVTALGSTGSASQIKFDMDAKADGGFMAASMGFVVDGIVVSIPALEPFADLMPRRIAMRPVVSHVGTKEFLQLLRAAIENPDAGPPPAEVAALFKRGGVKAGLESFALEMGGATFTGMASFDFPTPSQASGTAQITATGFDALLAKVQENPALAQGVPVLVLAKGFGRNVENRLVWDITYKNNTVLVNGVDLSKMGGK